MCESFIFHIFSSQKRVKREEAKVDIWKWILSNPLQLCVTASFAFDINIGTSILIFLFNFQCWVSFSSFFFLMFYSIAELEWMKVCSISMDGLVTCLTANEKRIYFLTLIFLLLVFGIVLNFSSETFFIFMWGYTRILSNVSPNKFD